MTNSMKEIIENHGKRDPFKYMLLDRMKQDCGYFLGNGNRCEKHLWSGSVKEHIDDMKALYNSFEDKDKPEWLTMTDIENFENEMTK